MVSSPIRSTEDSSQDKENLNQDKLVVLQNRRDSLSKGILKNVLLNDQNNTISIQLPLRSSAALNGGKKSYRRRVSFAPEVTLHKIDFIPQQIDPQEYQPKRRETIASSSRLVPQSPVLPKTISKVYENESSDVEMEDDTHVHSSPHKSLHSAENHAEMNLSDSDNYTETIDMSIMRESEDEADEGENTMDLTKQLGTIRLQQHAAKASDRASLIIPAQASVPKSLFGSIKDLFGEEYADQDIEQEMDLTQPHTTFSRKKDQNSSPAGNKTDVSFKIPKTHSTDLSSSRIKEIFRDELADNTQVAMEQTQPVGSIKTFNVNIQRANGSDNSPDQNLTEEVTIDETKNYSTLTDTKNIQPKRVSSQRTPLKAARSHTSETGSPMSSKRKRSFAEKSKAADLREKINSRTPEKKRQKVESPRTSFTSPVSNSPNGIESVVQVSTQLSSQENAKSTFTPLRTSKRSENYLLSQDKVEFNVSNEKASLAPSEEEPKTYHSHEYQPVSLKQFLSDLSIEFFDDLNMKDSISPLRPTLSNNSFDPVEYAIAKFSKLPSLELYSFSCDELEKNMTELKQLFDNLDIEFSEENPQLVKDYYQLSSLPQQKKMGDFLLSLKTYSDKEAEKSWGTWRKKLLDELILRLQNNLGALETDKNNSQKAQNALDLIDSQVEAEYSDAELQLQRLLETKEKIENDNDNIGNLRRTLIQLVDSLVSRDKEVSQLNTEILDLNQKKAQLEELEKEVEQKRMHLEMMSESPDHRIDNLSIDFAVLESVSGFKFNGLHGTSLSLRIMNNNIGVTIDIVDLDNPDQRTLVLPLNLPERIRSLFQRFLIKSRNQELRDFLQNLVKVSNNLLLLNRELMYLGLICPSSIEHHNDEMIIRVQDFNKFFKYKVVFEIRLHEDSLFGDFELAFTRIKVAYGDNLDSKQILQNLKQKVKGSIWVNAIDKVEISSGLTEIRDVNDQ